MSTNLFYAVLMVVTMFAEPVASVHFPQRNGLMNSRITFMSSKDDMMHPKFARNSVRLMSSMEEDGSGEQLEAFTHLAQEWYGQKLSRNEESLSTITAGSTKIKPWPGSYWPMYKDGMNTLDTEGPAVKYAKAMSLDSEKIKLAASKHNGALYAEQTLGWNTKCSHTIDCNGEGECVQKPDGSGGICVANWMGSCNAWSIAATIHPEPKCQVKRNDVTFSLTDLKSLITAMYHETDYLIMKTGEKCTDTNIDRDEDGRPTKNACKDVNPGAFHIYITNFIGRYRRSVVMDIEAGYQIWNHPIYAYQINSRKVLSEAEAAAAVKQGETNYKWNEEATKFVEINMSLFYVTEYIDNISFTNDPNRVDYFRHMGLTYILELNNEGDIVGGEWTGASKTRHPDFLWAPLTKPKIKTVADGIQYDTVVELLKESANGQC